MRRTLRFTARATDDLATIRAYIRHDSASAAQKQMVKFCDLFRLLLKNPGMGEVRRDLPQLNIRSVSVGSYVIYFRQRTDVVELLRIVHGALDMPSIE
jgi:toxin ParE1/3/4